MRDLVLGYDWWNIALIVVVSRTFEGLLVILRVLTLNIAPKQLRKHGLTHVYDP